MHYQMVIDFWFNELTPADWWGKSDELDNTINARFGHIHTAATALELYAWRAEPYGRLAEIIVLDQFSRNIFRNQAQAFAYDGIALALAQEAVNLQVDQHLKNAEKSFLYMPYMHSESLLVHDQAIILFSQPGLENNLDFEHKHRDIIARFQRYPHRNQPLGRESTEEEKVFLLTNNSSF
ncbi:hypothetical protein AB835_05305 [Candidatus Endobugula sertula]|uniref:DUF924 domain-containing protein n=1 Tax=Candidatus Endobugula sertula TaxID=62101 RepID=A0A1D2QRD4_9GAMM|nr:hypothetical protein AB835_05305 [Candidatus Endobugula sertula]